MATQLAPAPRLAAAYSVTDELFRVIRSEVIYERPISERHRLIFYLGHLEAFDWNLCREPLGLSSFHPEFDRLFAFGIDPVEGTTPTDQPWDWPTVDEVQRYNRRVRSVLDGALGRLSEQLFNVVIEHRLMHAETLAYLLHQLPYAQKHAQGQRSVLAAPAARNDMIRIPAGTATLGMRSGAGFGWDNEFEEHAVEVPEFAISRFKVSNREYLEFVDAGGEPSFFWERAGREWRWQGMFGSFPLPLDWPVYVTHRQATDYAAWRGLALPTEAQFHRAAYGTPSGDERPYPWGHHPPSDEHGNFGFRRWDPVPVNAHSAGRSAFGVEQLIGNGWEWTSSVFAPFPGFRPFPFYPGYSANFFDAEHYVMKGASPRTADVFLRRSFRNWFRPNYPYVYGAFRCVEN